MWLCPPTHSVCFQTSPCPPRSISRILIDLSGPKTPPSGPSQVCPLCPAPSQGRATIHFLSPSLAPFQLLILHCRGVSLATWRCPPLLGFLKEAEECPRTCYLFTYWKEGTPPSGRPQSLLASLHSVPTPVTQGSKALSQLPAVRSLGQEAMAGSRCITASGRRRGKEGWVGGGQRQVSPHVKGAGAGSYYLLGSRCPLASPGSAGSSATEHRGQCQSRPGSERADTHAQRDTGVHRDRATRTAPMDTHTHATAVPMQLH